MSPEYSRVLQRMQTDDHYSAAIFWSVVLHAAIVLLLVLRIHQGSPQLPSISADVIEAVVVDASVLDAIEEKKQQQAERKREAAEQKLRAEQERKLALQKKKEAEKKAAEQKRLQEQRKLDEAARKAEEREQLEAARRREQEQLLADEAAAARAQAQQKELASALQLYAQAIKQKVTLRWIKVPSAISGQVCEAVIRQIPGGEVVGVQMGACEGDAALQRSVEQAIYMASPLPTPEDPRVFTREILFEFTVP
jgi:colicin import membrane protein